MRQVDAAAHGRGARGGDRGRDLDRRARGGAAGAAGPRHRDGLPELRALPPPHRREEPRLRPQGAEDAEGRDRAARAGGRSHARARGPPRPAPRGALRRPAPARRHGPGDRARAGRVPDGRAALEPRREAARRHARRAGPAARSPRDHDDLRHPRPDRGDDARRSRGRDARRHDPAGRHAADALPGARQPLRRRVHRLALDEPRRSRAHRRHGRLRRLPPAAEREAASGAAGRPAR